MIRLDNGDHIITLTIIGQENRDADTYTKPLLSTMVDIITPTISTDYLTYIRTDEIHQFYDNVLKLQATKDTMISLITLETGIQIEASQTANGLIDWHVQCMNPESDGGMYNISFENTVDELEKIRVGLKEVLEMYDGDEG